MSIRASVRALSRYHFTPRASTVKLDQNESPSDLPEALKAEAVTRLSASSWQRYPELHPQTLERAIARRHDWDPEGVVVANGSNVLLQALVIAAGIGQSVVTVTPTFPVYAMQAQLLGGDLVEVPLGPGFRLPGAELAAALRGRRGVAFVANPAAPTGNLHSREELAPLLAAIDDDWLLVLDEAYADFARSDHLDLVARQPQLVSVRTFSKAFGLAGVRVGYLLAHPEVAVEVRKALLPFSLSSLQAAVALTVLDHPAYVEGRVALAVRERDRLFQALTELPGVVPLPSATNFLLFRVERPDQVYAGLLERGVAIRRQDHLPGLDGYLRVTAGALDENDAFLRALREVLEPEVVGG